MPRDNLAGLASATIVMAMLLAACSGSEQIGSLYRPRRLMRRKS